MPAKSRAVVLLSGGLDSATALAEARAAGFELNALTVRYGQRHAVEIEAARRVARAMGVARHVELEIDLRALRRQRLTSDAGGPQGPPDDAMTAQGIPITYVPARNTVFLSLALAWAETLGGLRHLHRRQLRRLLGLSRLPARIPAVVRGPGQPGDAGRRRRRRPIPDPRPALDPHKEQIIERGRALGVDYSLTHSCYDPTPEGLSCGRCDACRIRRSAFERLGLDGSDRLCSSASLTPALLTRSPVDPLVRRVVELDFLLVQVELVAAADEVDPQGLVLDDRLAAAGWTEPPCSRRTARARRC